LQALRGSRRGCRIPIVPAGTMLWGHGRRCLRRVPPVTGTAIRCATADSAGEGWTGGNHRCWPLVDRVDDLGVVDPAQISGGDPEIGVLDMRVIWPLRLVFGCGLGRLGFSGGCGCAVGAKRRSA